MAIAQHQDLQQYCTAVAVRAKEASSGLCEVTSQQKDDWLRGAANRLRASTAMLAEENGKDLAAAPDFGLTDAQIDRLLLTDDLIEGIAQGLEKIAMLPDPIGEVIDSSVRPNGLKISRVRVPLGVVFFVYESRPNVTADAAAICVKSGNAVILRCGKEAAHSSRAIVEVLQAAAKDAGIPTHAVQIVNVADHEAVGHFLALDQYIDLAIPRGGEELIRRVAAEARMPVLKHFRGNCHVYVDAAADLDMATSIVVNSKCQRMGVCNACESLLVDAGVASEFLPRVAALLAQYDVELRGDEKTCELVSTAVAASEDDYSAEFLAPILSVKVVESLDEAVEHINRFGSGHTDTIVTGDLAAARKFTRRVDSAVVFVNASTRLNDGGEFGLGAEIGISTDKFHARGPCGLREMTTYKWVAYGITGLVLTIGSLD